MDTEQVKICDKKTCVYEKAINMMTKQLSTGSKEIFDKGYYAIDVGNNMEADIAIISDMIKELRRLKSDNKIFKWIILVLVILLIICITWIIIK